MKMEINGRGNGACPLCLSGESCRIQDTLSKTLAAMFQDNEFMEMVIYTCPRFEEKTEGE